MVRPREMSSRDIPPRQIFQMSFSMDRNFIMSITTPYVHARSVLTWHYFVYNLHLVPLDLLNLHDSLQNSLILYLSFPLHSLLRLCYVSLIKRFAIFCPPFAMAQLVVG